MKTQIRDLVVNALYPSSAHILPAICERLGMDAGTSSEAFASKKRYIMLRLQKLSDGQVLNIAQQVAIEFPDEPLKSAIEKIVGRDITAITRDHLAIALDEYPLGGSKNLLGLLRSHWPEIDHKTGTWASTTKADVIYRHAVQNDDWSSSDILECVGFHDCSQGTLFRFLEDLLHPIRRVDAEQQAIVAKLNPILRRDGYCLIPGPRISEHSTYKITETIAAGAQPADHLISEVLLSYDEDGVHAAWQKALERRQPDPEGAITAAKTLLETVCKHIIDEEGGAYGPNDDLPKLYNSASKFLKLAPSQHTEAVFKEILGSCHSVVNSLAGLRNKLGDSHGQGKRYVKPLPRHAELAVNLAGSAAMFLISTWTARQVERKSPP